MKKPIAILLVLLILLNTSGYYLVFMGLQHNNDVAANRQLDADIYDPARAVTISIPFTVPYVSGTGDFERVEGTFQHKGEVYRMVKQRFANDTLTVICIQDDQAGEIQNAIADYVKTFTDKPLDQKGSTKLAGTFIKEYTQSTFSIISQSLGWKIEVGQTPSFIIGDEIFIAQNTPPPEYI